MQSAGVGRVVAGLLVALGLGQAYGIKVGHTLGIYAGSMTSTASLQAALDVMQNKEPSSGYSIAYPFGVIGPILCIYFMTPLVQPKVPPKAQQFHMGEISLGNNCSGQTLERPRQGVAERGPGHDGPQGGQNIVPSADIVLSSGDGLMIIAEQPGRIPRGSTRLGGGARPDRQGSFCL